MYQFSVFASRVELDVDNTDTDEACDSSFEEGNFSTKIEFVEKFYPLPSSYFTPRSILHFTLWESSSSRPQNSSFSHQTLKFQCTKHKFTVNRLFLKLQNEVCTYVKLKMALVPLQIATSTTFILDSAKVGNTSFDSYLQVFPTFELVWRYEDDFLPKLF